jgi:nitroreductase/NAD-dependent dihydropyrimidine dehydrogenase PreA subunit
MKTFTIDLEKCNRDGICALDCPTNVIQLDSPEDVPHPSPDFEAYCLKCGHCTAVCPTGAFSLDWLSPEQCKPIDKALVLSEPQTEHFLRSRRSIRHFKDQPVEAGKLARLLEIACYAPTAKNNQPWHWTVVRDAAQTRRLAGMVIEWMRSVIQQSPEQAELRGLPRVVSAWDGGEERICRGAPHIIVVHCEKDYGFGAEDSALALSYLELYAPAIGLGSCWGGYFYSAINAYPKLFDALELPADHRACGAVMVGYPKLKYQRMPLRNQPRVRYL